MRVAIGGVSHETNTFSNIRTTPDLFQQCAGQAIFDAFAGTQSSLGGFIDVAAREDFDGHPDLFRPRDALRHRRRARRSS